MNNKSIPILDDHFLTSIENLKKMRAFSGEPAEFWPSYLKILVNISLAQVGVIVIRPKSKESAWRIVAREPSDKVTGYFVNLFNEHLDETAAKSIKDGIAYQKYGEVPIMTIRQDVGDNKHDCLAVLILKSDSESRAFEYMKTLHLVSDIPQNYQQNKGAIISKIHVEQFSNVLDLMVLLNAEKKFLAAAMVFCNELASRHKCDRVSLGWIKKGYIRLVVTSHVDQFDKKMEAVQQMEMAMEETFDQNTEIILPKSPDHKTITVDHEKYSEYQKAQFLYSIPLRINGEPEAVCLCERSTNPFTNTEAQLLRLSCDQTVTRLADLKQSDRWFGARWASTFREKMAQFLGFEHTWTKILGILGFLILAFVCFVPLPFRVEAKAIIRTDDLSYLSAPFSGHIDKVYVRMGDLIEKGAPILDFDQSNLKLEKASLESEIVRYQREFEKARANNALAEMRIAQALRDQSEAQLEIVIYRLNQTLIKAPFNGIIVEGDLAERIGSPIKEGDILFKLARAEHIYPELEVNETDIHLLSDDMTGELALISRPQENYDIKIVRVEPIAVSKEEGNIFILHADISEENQKWWRPGMTGIAKLNAGEQTLLWIMTRRTVDFLRLRLWW